MMMEYGMCCCRMSGRRAWNAYGEKQAVRAERGRRALWVNNRLCIVSARKLNIRLPGIFVSGKERF